MDWRAATSALLKWYGVAARPLPWRENPTPYRVWLSEIMLQQTRIEAVKGYFARFLEAFPSIEALAAADEATLLKTWEGLGYYSRARNLKAAAQEIVARGAFPETPEELAKLPGIGPYTAAAVASIAFNRPAVAVDGNVLRVLSRLCGRTLTRPEATSLLAPRIPEGTASLFTQAWMELGEVLCIPNGTPSCLLCPLAPHCQALREGTVANLPEPVPKKARRIELRTVFLLRHQNRIAIRQRPARGLLAGLWEFPGTDGTLSRAQARSLLEQWGLGKLPSHALHVLPPAKHIFTHVEWQMTCYEARVPCAAQNFTWATLQELTQKYPIPTAFQAIKNQIS
ncbi:MAG: A/G-specific adenine glycosylase [Victivallales bacterium]|nr:A/G-specific adenine glycosylase [Victivallales bacterium]